MAAVVVVAVAVSLAAWALAPSTALAAKGVVGVLGSGSFGANSPRGVAVNSATGDVYVVDGGGHRLLRFGSDGDLVSAWGFDVVVPGGADEQTVVQSEVQSVTLSSLLGAVTGGTFTLSLTGQVTGAIAYDAAADDVEAALEALANVGPGNVSVSGSAGGPWTVEFVGALAGTDLAALVGDAAGLTGTGFFNEVAIATVQNGGVAPAFEVCTIAAECKAGVASAVAGGMNTPHGVAVDQSDGSVYVTDGANFRVQEFSAAGVFERAWGWDVDATGGSPTTFEVCVAPAVCKAGLSGSGDGQFGATFNGHLGVEPGTGRVVVADPGAAANRRLQRFNSLGAFESKFGASGAGAGQFGTGSPSRVAVDSGGAVYAVDVGNNRVQKLLPMAGSYVATTFAAATLTGTTVVPFAVAVDPVDHHVYVARRASGGTSEIWVQEYSSDGTLLETHGQGAGIGVGLAAATVNQNAALAFHRGTGALYLTVPGAAGVGRVLVLDDEPLPQPEAVFTAADVTAVGPRTATFSGAVDPNGGGELTTGYRFEYALQGSDAWTRVPGADVSVGSGDDPVAVGPVTVPDTLLPNQAYKVRLVATKLFQPPAYSDEQTFTTDTIAPEDVVALAAGPIRTDAAQLRGTLHPVNAETDWRFEYGTSTDYGSSVPVPAGKTTGNATVNVARWVHGLQPGTTYHYRLVAANADDPGLVTASPDQTFTTGAVAQPPAGRAYEMVTPAYKVGRVGAMQNGDDKLAGPGVPSVDGDSMMFGLTWTGLDPDAQAVVGIDPNRIVRTERGWDNQPVMNTPILGPPLAAQIMSTGAAPDQSISTWGISGGDGATGGSVLFPEEVGGPAFGNYLRFLTSTPSWAPSATETLTPRPGWARLAGDGARGVMGRFSDDRRWLGMHSGVRGLAGPGDPSSAQPAGAGVVYRLDLDTGLSELVSACTAGTEIPERVGAGLATDTISAQPCSAGSLVNARGASLGVGVLGSTLGAQFNATNFQGKLPEAMSRDGRRMFFMSPDPGTPGAPPTGLPTAATAGCTTAVGTSSNCQPQLYVRQWGSSGGATVRWISRSEVPDQQVGLLGRGAGFEAASEDGRVVYFRTNAPLTADDRNGTAQAPATTGTASASSWDLYRYELPDSHDDDPAEGKLTRISAGPIALGAGDLTSGSATVTDVATSDGEFVVDQVVSGAGIPAGTTIVAVGTGTLTLSVPAAATSTGVALTAAADPGTGSTVGAAVVRHFSEDGSRAYFVTASPIAGADNTSPAGSAASNVPGGTPTDTTMRNVYLFDADKSGAERWKFVARVPYANAGIGGCTASYGTPGLQYFNNLAGQMETSGETLASCFRGSKDGRFAVFMTAGAVTADDGDSAFDVYAYDAGSDSLIRVSAPQDGAPGGEYACTATCNADLGMEGFVDTPSLMRGWRGLRGYNIGELGGGEYAVYFESRGRLVPEDVNGSQMDVYQWKDGDLSLISPGTGDHDAYFSGNGESGRDVFFQTSEPIDPHRELEPGDFDIYDARIGGGFPPPPERPPVCDVAFDACQGAGVAAVEPRVASSPPGDGNTAVGPRNRLAVAAVSPAGRRRAVRTGRLAIVVRTRAAGRISARASGRVGGRVRGLGRAAVQARRAGRMRLVLRLNPLARTRLRSGRALGVTVRVSQAGARPRSITVRLQRGARR